MADALAGEAIALAVLTGHRLGPYLSFNPVSATQIWQWCSAMGDQNPAYQPGEGQCAPRAMMQMWTMRDCNDCYAPGSTDAPPYQVFDDMQALGYPANVAVSYDIHFLRDLALGERPAHFTTVVNISDRKTTSLGVGYFVTERVEYTTLEESPFAEALITYFQYRPIAKDAGNSLSENLASSNKVSTPNGGGESAGAVRSVSRAATESTEDQVKAQQNHPLPASDSQPNFKTLNPSELAPGDALPSLAIAITHRLIVGGAIATQDFIPVHHNVPAATAAGMPDIFMNILTTCGLSARYLGDWAGQAGRMQRIQFSLMAPNLPGDTMVMEGSVTAIEQQEAEALVTVAFAGRNGLGFHTRGSAVVALPLRAS